MIRHLNFIISRSHISMGNAKKRETVRQVLLYIICDHQIFFVYL